MDNKNKEYASEPVPTNLLLVFNVSQKGITMNPLKIQSILNIPPPLIVHINKLSLV